MRIDLFLRRTGILKQRTEAARLLREGRVLVDGAPAKPASAVRAGQRIRVETARALREWEVIRVPAGNVRRSERERFVRMTSESRKAEE